MFRGTIIRGDGAGKPMGYPTANLDCSKKDVRLGVGVYAVWAYLKKKKYMGALVVQDNPFKIEVHLIDYTGEDVYDLVLEVDPVQKVSEIERHSSLEELQQKIENDVRLAEEVLVKM